MLVLGAKEHEAETVSPRHSSGRQLDAMATLDFAKLVKEECGTNWRLGE